MIEIKKPYTYIHCQQIMISTGEICLRYHELSLLPKYEAQQGANLSRQINII